MVPLEDHGLSYRDGIHVVRVSVNEALKPGRAFFEVQMHAIILRARCLLAARLRHGHSYPMHTVEADMWYVLASASEECIILHGS